MDYLRVSISDMLCCLFLYGSGSAVSVSIAGIECVYDVGESSATEIVCTTGAHSGTIVAPVLAIIDGARATGVSYSLTIQFHPLTHL